MRQLALFAGLLLSTTAQAGDFWSGLWQTPDQRGEHLLQNGNAAAAAQAYADPRRKAYAELKAGDAAAAARDLAPLDEGEAHYNRGNALVQQGDLESALKAYDSALARDPHNRDAQHNRELVEQALKKKQQQSQQSGKDGKNGDDTKTDREQNSDKNDPSSNQSENSSQQQNSKQAEQKPGDQNRNADRQQAQSSQDQHSGEKDQARKENQGNPKSGSDQAQQRAAKSESDKDAEQARRDVAASLAKDDAKPDKAAHQVSGTADNENMKPGTEQQLAQEQWLRRIPDDPGGLLRRKFLIEHMMRQQQAQKP